MENGSNLYTINTATGAGTQVGTTDSNGYLTSVLLFENGTYYTGAGSVFGTINIATGQITPHSSVFGGPGSIVALAPLSSSNNYYFSDFAFGGGNWESTLTYINYSPQTVTCITNFYGDNGAPLGVPFARGPSPPAPMCSRREGRFTIRPLRLIRGRVVGRLGAGRLHRAGAGQHAFPSVSAPEWRSVRPG